MTSAERGGQVERERETVSSVAILPFWSNDWTHASVHSTRLVERDVELFAADGDVHGRDCSGPRRFAHNERSDVVGRQLLWERVAKTRSDADVWDWILSPRPPYTRRCRQQTVPTRRHNPSPYIHEVTSVLYPPRSTAGVRSVSCTRRRAGASPARRGRRQRPAARGTSACARRSQAQSRLRARARTAGAT